MSEASSFVGAPLCVTLGQVIDKVRSQLLGGCCVIAQFRIPVDM